MLPLNNKRTTISLAPYQEVDFEANFTLQVFPRISNPIISCHLNNTTNNSKATTPFCLILQKNGEKGKKKVESRCGKKMKKGKTKGLIIQWLTTRFGRKLKVLEVVAAQSTLDENFIYSPCYYNSVFMK